MTVLKIILIIQLIIIFVFREAVYTGFTVYLVSMFVPLVGLTHGVSIAASSTGLLDCVSFVKNIRTSR